jgi:hypothetical protein
VQASLGCRRGSIYSTRHVSSEVASLLHRAVSGWTLFVTARLVSRHLGRVVSPATGYKFDVRVFRFRCLFPCCTLLLIHYLYTDRSALTQIQQDSGRVGALTGNRKINAAISSGDRETLAPALSLGITFM